MSRERMALPRGVVALRILTAPGAPPGAVSTVSPGCVPLPALELKAIQRRAYERGQACAHAELERKLGALMAALDRAISELAAQRDRDRDDLSAFGVELALTIAGQIVGTAVASGTHDVRALADTVIEEAMPALGAGPVEIFVHPADLEALGEPAAGRERSLSGRMHFAKDPEVPRGGCRLKASGAEVLADPKARLVAIAERLRAVAAAERHDA